MKTTPFELASRGYIIKHFKSSFLLIDRNIELKTELNDARFSLNKSRHSPKNIVMWEGYGLIDDNRKEKTGWKKYSFSESVWLDLILRLKKFGLHKKTILPVIDMFCENNDKAKISKYPLLDFYIKLIVLEGKQVFLLTDYRANSVLITKEQLDSVELTSNYEHEDMVKINLNSLVNKLLEELPMELSNNLHLSLNN
jgi:DNA-binding transcriptional MerR regulator